MEIEQILLPGVMLITPRRVGDNRGFFSESWNRQRMVEAGILGETFFVVPGKCGTSRCFAISWTVAGFHGLVATVRAFQAMLHPLSKLDFWLSGWRPLSVLMSIRRNSKRVLALLRFVE